MKTDNNRTFDYQAFVEIMNVEMVPSLGCTDPSSIAYVSATCRKYLDLASGRTDGELPSGLTIHAFLTRNLIKNASAVVIPGTDGICGPKPAAVLGAIAGDADRELEALDGLTTHEIETALALVEKDIVTISMADTQEKLYIRMIMEGDGHVVETELVKEYNNISAIKVDGEYVLSPGAGTSPDGGPSQAAKPVRYDLLNLAAIKEFADNASLEQLSHVAEAIEMNRKISEEGFAKPYGMRIGQYFRNQIEKDGLATDDFTAVSQNASMWLAAGIDARMAGCPLPAMSNAGSGNQGIADVCSVIGAGEALGLSDEQILRAAAVCLLTTIYMKKKLGNLSTVCGGTLAGAAFGCTVVYMMNGTVAEMVDVLKNTFGNILALVCDGAKASCALKLVTSIQAGTMAAGLALEGKGLPPNNGMVGTCEEDTIDYFIRCAVDGLSAMDDVVMDVMMEKISAGKC